MIRMTLMMIMTVRVIEISRAVSGSGRRRRFLREAERHFVMIQLLLRSGLTDAAVICGAFGGERVDAALTKSGAMWRRRGRGFGAASPAAEGRRRG